MSNDTDEPPPGERSFHISTYPEIFMNERQIFKMAADAFLHGKVQEDNPFSEEQQSAEHEAWRLGFGEESAYWEYQYGINVHGR